MTVNRNAIPFDVNGPWYTSGVRMGTPALTTLGMKEKEMKEIGNWIVGLLKATQGSKESRAKADITPSVLKTVRKNVEELLKQFPLYPEIMIN